MAGRAAVCSDGTAMKLRYIVFNDFTKLTLPDVCPNCLDSGLNKTPLTFGETAETDTTRSIGGWHYCKECHRWLTDPGRWTLHYVILPAFLLKLVALIIAWSPINAEGEFGSTYAPLALLAVTWLSIGTFAVWIVHFCRTPPKGGKLHGPALRSLPGRIFTRGARRLVIRCWNPKFSEILVETTAPDKLIYRPEKLSTAVRNFDEIRAHRATPKTTDPAQKAD